VQTAAELERRYARTRRAFVCAVVITALLGLTWRLAPLGPRLFRQEEPHPRSVDGFIAGGAARDAIAEHNLELFDRCAWIAWDCSFGFALGLVVVATLRWRLWRINDAIARANSLARMADEQAPKVNVLGE
jgi:hypothetical protein